MRSESWATALLCAMYIVASAVVPTQGNELNGSLDDAAREYLTQRNALETNNSREAVLADWAYSTNLTNENLKHLMDVESQHAAKNKEEWKKWINLGWDKKWLNISDPQLRRQMKGYSTRGKYALPEEKFNLLNEITANMTAIYSTAKVDLCVQVQGKSVCSLNLEPELTQIMAENRSYDVLKEAWVKWRDVSGKQVRGLFRQYVELSNEAATLNGYSDAEEEWVHPYESPTFQNDVEAIWQQIKPLYEQLHAYVRRKLIEVYGTDHINKTGPIPAHLLGNMWAQSWTDIYDLVAPFPDKSTIDVTTTMKSQGYTPKKIFELADKFYTELNLVPMPPEFWEKSVITKPNDTEMVCHASAWDFYNSDDVRIKMCTDVTMEDLNTVHHEMGHVEYYLHYKNQPILFRTGANPGFHEAVGDSLALSVQTPKHLHRIGLLNEIVEDNETDINFLMKMALSKIVFLPFGYLIDRYRWQVFNGTILSDDLNCEWWKLRFELQGLKPPVLRTEEDFDPGAKYHVVADVPYIRYFVSFIVQFQFHKAMCLKAGQYDPNDPSLALHKCDIANSTAAGEALGAMLSLGGSVPWPDALESLTGTRELDATVLGEYFKPLEDWLTQDNQAHGQHIGWENDGEYCEGPTTRTDLKRH
ncbi:Peptidase M2 peptidyl-dipeptidase A [Trinorchestia longiramus]|nr:Peptidase M2 peptidyl-dipeptidase A [Trinorchestia longiramus]